MSEFDEGLREILNELHDNMLEVRDISTYEYIKMIDKYIDQAHAQIKALIKKEVAPEERNNETNLDLTTAASADWQFYYEDKGFNDCRTEILKRIG